MTKMFLLIFAMFSLNVFAGGIAFDKPLTGINPLTGRQLTLESQGGIGGAVAVPVKINGQEGTMTMISRNFDPDIGETILSISIGGETLRGVLSGDCQSVERMTLILPSGAHILLQD